ncbi:2Fe-2S iron-sulfur cluster-binding protein [Streptomyces sp. NBC_01089]|uniref:(2Fe-2S)-binding protein n=1 Tax=Streptomyces sp. NBC_01089 TaxID=2903747 RepID=UPI00386B09E3
MDPSGAPLAAPGHGYVPPMILPLTPAAGTDPAGTGQWTVPQMPQAPDPAQQQPQQEYQPYQPHPSHQAHQPHQAPETPYWPEPAQDPHAGPGYPHEPVATGQWTFGDAQQPPVPEQPHQQQHQPQQSQQSQQHGGDLTGQWTIPVAEGDVPEESGEYTASSLMRPATLPGGAPAPWAVPQEPEPAEPAEQPAEPAGHGTPADGTPVPQDEHGTGTEPPAVDGPGTAGDEPDPRDGHEAGPGRHDVPDGHEVQDRHGVPDPRVAEFAAAPVADPETARPTDGADAAHADAAHADPAHPDAVRSDAVRSDAVRSDAVQADTTHADPALPDTAHADPAPPGTGAADPGVPLAPDAAPAVAWSEHTPASYVLRVNGTDRPVTDAWIGESLLYVLRERLGLAGAKDGCSQGECGACNVQVDGRLVASCLVPAATAAGSEVRTVEGLAVNGEPSDVQRALSECGAVQCGFCIPGMAMTVHDLLEGNHAPTELETRQALCGNLCRCSGYRGVLDAVGEVVAGRAAAGAASEEARIPHQAAPGSGGMQPDNPQQHDGGMA